MGGAPSAARQAVASHGPIVPRELSRLASLTVAKGTVAREDQAVMNSDVTKLLRGARAIYTDVAALARGADRSFDAISYEWDADSNVAQLMVRGILDNVAARLAANRGVPRKKAARKARGALHVRFMTDHSSLFDMVQGQRKYAQVRATVRQLQEAVAAMGKAAQALLRIEARVWRHETLGSNHSKYFLQDGTRVVLTGCNIDSYYDWSAAVPDARGAVVRRARTSWHDTGLRMEGPVAAVLLGAFNSAWAQGTVAARSREPPDAAPRRRSFARTQYTVPLMVASKDFHTFNRSDIQNPQDVAWLYLMAHAQRHVYIETPNINDSEFQLAVLNAVHRGVEVRLITGYQAGDSVQKQWFVGGGTNEFIIQRLRAYLAAHEAPAVAALFQPRWYSHDGAAAVVGYAEGASHTKFLSVDGAAFMTGSGNQDTQSWKHSRETNVVVFHARVTREANAAFFLPDWRKAVAVAPPTRPVAVPRWLNSDFTGI